MASANSKLFEILQIIDRLDLSRARCGADETMDTTLMKLVSSMRACDVQSNAKDPRAVGLLVRLLMVAGTAQQVSPDDINKRI